MKKALLITMQYPPANGGVEQYLHNISSLMPKEKWVVLAPQAGPEMPTESGVYRRNFFSSLMWPRWLPLVWAAYRIIKKERIDYLIAGQLLPVGTAVHMLGTFLKIPYSVFTYGLDVMNAAKHGRKKKIAETILRQAHSVFTISDFTKNELARLSVSPERIVKIRPLLDSNFFRHVDDEKKEALRKKMNLGTSRILLTVSRLVERKGHRYILLALQKLIKEFPEIHYIIAGDGPERPNLEEYVLREKLGEHVTFTGKISEDEKRLLYSVCDIFVMTPISDAHDVEGFGMVYLEAQAYGKPVIGTSVGGVEEAVGGYGFIVEPGRAPEEICACVRQIFADPVRAEVLGKKAQERIRSMNWDSELIPLYRLIEREHV